LTSINTRAGPFDTISVWCAAPCAGAGPPRDAAGRGGV